MPVLNPKVVIGVWLFHQVCFLLAASVLASLLFGSGSKAEEGAEREIKRLESELYR